MTPRDKAQSGLQIVREAIADLLRERPGLTPAQIQAELGLDPLSVLHVVAGIVMEAVPGQPCC